MLRVRTVREKIGVLRMVRESQGTFFFLVWKKLGY